MTPFTSENTRLIDRFALDAAADVAKAQSFLDQRTTSKAAFANAEQAFLANLTSESARDLVEAANRVRDFAVICDAIENSGGSEAVRVRALDLPAVYSAFLKGFEERILALQKTIPNGRKHLAERRGELTEQGTNLAELHWDPICRAWVEYLELIMGNIAAAEIGKGFAAVRGVGCEKRSFNELYAALVTPLPVPPPILAAAAA
jgi:hypothetical protein